MIVESLSLVAVLLSTAATNKAALSEPSPVVQPGLQEPAPRQESQAQEGGLQDIVVTAQKLSENVNNVPLSISAITGDTLAARGIHSGEDLATAVPSLSFTNSGFNAPVYTLRGVGFNDGSLLASPTVAVYVDEVPLAYAAMTKGALLDVQRVEVLKGPQGTLYGTNSTGGAINYVAAVPTEALSGGVNGEFGRFNAFDASGYLSGALADGLKARLSVRTAQSGDWQKSITRDDTRGASNQIFGRLLLDWETSPSLRFQFNASGWKDKSDTQAPQAFARLILTPSSLTPEVANAPLSPETSRAADWTAGRNFKNNDGFYQLSAKGVWGFTPGLSLTSITAYSRYDVDARQDRDGVNIEDQEYNFLGSISSFHQEMRFAYEGDNGMRLLLGANYRHDRGIDRNVVYGEYLTTLRQSATVGIDGIINDTDQKVKSYGLFGDAIVPLTNTISITGGLRYSNETKKFAGCSRDTGSGELAARFAPLSAALKANNGLPAVPGQFVPGGCITLNSTFDPVVTRNELTGDNLSIKAGINWRPADRTLFYASFNRGFKAGGFPNPAATFASQYTPVRQEKIDAYELGFKVSLLDRVIQVNGAVFRYDYTDKQLYSRLIDPFFGPVRGLVNIPRSRVNGAEVQVDAAPTDWLSLYVAGSYIDSKVLKGQFYNQANVLESLIGRPFNFAPKWQLNTGYNTKTPISQRLDIMTQADVTYRSATTGDFGSGPLFAVKAYALLNARIAIADADGRWNAAIWGRNLTNTYYFNQVVPGGDFVTRFVGKPVTYGISVGYHF